MRQTRCCASVAEIPDFLVGNARYLSQKNLPSYTTQVSFFSFSCKSPPFSHMQQKRNKNFSLYFCVCQKEFFCVSCKMAPLLNIFCVFSSILSMISCSIWFENNDRFSFFPLSFPQVAFLAVERGGRKTEDAAAARQKKERKRNPKVARCLCRSNCLTCNKEKRKRTMK